MGPFSAGTTFRATTGGGGGWGSPGERDPSLVLTDVRDELLSPSEAREIYGVSVVAHNGQWTVDPVETRRLRSV